MEISPSVLEFSGSFTQPTTEYLSLTNTSDTPLAYKVKTTAPKLYCVRPNASIIEPGATVKISIILQGFSQPLPEDYKCKDKFLLVTLPCPELVDATKVSDHWSSLEAQFKSKMVSKKLRVNYVIGEASSSSSGAAAGAAVPQGTPLKNSTNASDVSESAAAASGIVAAAQIEKSQPTSDLQKDLDESVSKINDLSEKLDTNASSTSSTTTATTTSTDAPVSGFSLPFAVILILIAFILGWLLL
ncbi:vesicle-associated membrane protein-associated protein Scs2p [[Candida] anglica]|uniref:Vesicle-associated membrane protein-associated protein Scs2p n=1 Tax=[Candida] anglica TaxID=148631 RepID=A0ABP0EKP3_9ASCO